MNSPRRKRGRPRGAAGGHRAAIIDAARDLFARRGYRGTTTREVARRARVDVALIGHFFGAKAGLFAEAIQLREVAGAAEAALRKRGGRRGEQLLRLHLDQLFHTRRQEIAALLRSILGDPGAQPELRQVIEELIVSGAAGALSGPDARLRAELFGAVVVGLFICRELVAIEPLASASTERIAGLLGRPLDQLLFRPR